MERSIRGEQKSTSEHLSPALAALHLLLRHLGRSRRGGARGLRLLHLLVLLLRLRLCDGCEALLCAHGGGLVAAGGDGREVRADDAALVLHGLARALLGDLLCDTLLVHAAVHDCPRDLARVLALQEERRIFRAGEAEHLRAAGQSVGAEGRGKDKCTLLSPRTKSLPLLG